MQPRCYTVLMSYDPQNAPEHYEWPVSMVMTDAEGVEIILVRNQDGVRYVVDLNDNPY